MPVLHTTLGRRRRDDIGLMLPHKHVFVDLRTPDQPAMPRRGSGRSCCSVTTAAGSTPPGPAAARYSPIRTSSTACFRRCARVAWRREAITQLTVTNPFNAFAR